MTENSMPISEISYTQYHLIRTKDLTFALLSTGCGVLNFRYKNGVSKSSPSLSNSKEQNRVSSKMTSGF